MEPANQPTGRPKNALRYSVRGLLLGTALTAVGLSLIALLPSAVVGWFMAAVKIGLPPVFLAMAWTSNGPSRAGWCAALLPLLIPETQRAISQILCPLFASPLVMIFGSAGRPWAELLCLISSCLASGSIAYLIASKRGLIN